jgi:bacteriocin biosynthesis cyclodehydratase domain-containing protein
MNEKLGEAAPPELPVRPRILPGFAVLRRRADEIQVGLDPRHAAVVSGLPEPVVAAAGELTGGRTAEEVLAAAGPDPAARSAMSELLGALAGRRLVEDAASEPDPPIPGRLIGDAAGCRLRAPWRPSAHPAVRTGLAVAVAGEGRLAVAIACLLAAAGVGWVHVAARGAVAPEDTGTGYLADDVGRARRAAARDAVVRVDGSVRTAPFGPGRRPDLVLLTDALVPAPDAVGVLTAEAMPHLLARVRDGVGIVGPLVVPGVTSCLHCADLRRTDRDECWPTVATQLAGRTQPAELACVQATAAFATAQALDALSWSRFAHKRPVVWNASVEIDPFAATTHHRVWPPHADCRCGAAALPG